MYHIGVLELAQATVEIYRVYRAEGITGRLYLGCSHVDYGIYEVLINIDRDPDHDDNMSVSELKAIRQVARQPQNEKPRP